MSLNLIGDFIFNGHELPAELCDESEQVRLNDFLYSRILKSRFHKGDHLLKVHQIPDKVYFMKEGVVSGYKIQQNGKRKLTHGWLNSAILTDGWQFVSQKPSSIYIEIVKNNVELISLHRSDITDMVERFPYTRHFYMSIIDNNIRNSNAQIVREYRGVEKLKSMREQWPGIELMAPKSFIAELLNISPQYLCRVSKIELPKR